MIKVSAQRKIFVGFNSIFLILFTILCLLPFINLLAVSFSSADAVLAGEVSFWPKSFTLEAYQYLIQRPEFFNAFGISVLRVVLGTGISVVVCVFAAYALSRHRNTIAGRKLYVIFLIVTMFFSGGLVPMYIIISKLNLDNTIWALTLPTATNGWNIVLLINFFRQVPHELEESAELDGAGHFRILFWITMPIILPAVATVSLLTAVAHWNAWFDGYIYMDSKNFPLQSYIYNIISQLQDNLAFSPNMSDEQRRAIANLPGPTLRSAQIFIAMTPILLVYSFAQRFFIKGLTMGSVKE